MPKVTDTYAKIRDEAVRQLQERGYIITAELHGVTTTTRQNVQQVILPKLARELKLERVHRHAWKVAGSPVNVPDQSAICSHFKVRVDNTAEFMDKIRQFALNTGDFIRVEVTRAMPEISDKTAADLLKELISSGELVYAEARRGKAVESTHYIHTSKWHQSIAGRIPKEGDNSDIGRIRKILLEYKEFGREFYGLNVADLLSVNNGLVNLELRRLVECGEIEVLRVERVTGRGAARVVYRFKMNLRGERHES